MLMTAAAAIAILLGAAHDVLMASSTMVGLLLAAGGSAGAIWQPLITLGEAGLTSAGAIGILVGAYMKATAGPDMSRQAVGSKIIRNAIGGFCVGALASAISALFFGFT